MPSLSAATTPGSRSTADAMIPEQPANHRPGNRLIPVLVVLLTYRSRFSPSDLTTRFSYLFLPGKASTGCALAVGRTPLERGDSNLIQSRRAFQAEHFKP